MENKKCLVLGGLGFVGRHLTKRLLSLGHNVHIVDDKSSNSSVVVEDWMPHLQPTNEEKTRLHVFIDDCRGFFKEAAWWDVHYDKIFHLAAVVGGRQTIEGDPLSVASDLSIDADFFNWLVKLPYKPEKVYYFSSSAAYPVMFQEQFSHFSLKEDMIDFDVNKFRQSIIGIPDMTYGWAKLTGEYLAKIAYDKYQIPIVVFRPFSGYGEDQGLDYPFTSLLYKVMNNQHPIEVWGSGKQERDFIYIEDCIDGILLLGDKINDARAVNLSTGIAHAFNHLILLMCAALKQYPPHIKSSEDKPTGVFSRVGDTTLQSSLGFKAKTLLIEGIEKCINYIQDEQANIRL